MKCAASARESAKSKASTHGNAVQVPIESFDVGPDTSSSHTPNTATHSWVRDDVSGSVDASTGSVLVCSSPASWPRAVTKNSGRVHVPRY
jgi:hypothetical protein